MRKRWLLAAGLVWIWGLGPWKSLAWDGAAWKALAEQWLSANFSEPRAHWRVWILSAPEAEKPEAPGANYRILGMEGRSRQPKKIIHLMVGRAGSDLPCGELVISAGKWRTVAICNRLLGRGEKLLAADWHWEERPTDSLPEDAIRQAEEMVNKRIKKVLAAKETITVHALEGMPDVRLGESVQLWIRGTGVVIRTEAQMLEEGAIGECLRMKNPDSGKIFAARIMGPGQAEIDLNKQGVSR